MNDPNCNNILNVFVLVQKGVVLFLETICDFLSVYMQYQVFSIYSDCLFVKKAFEVNNEKRGNQISVY